MPRTASTRKVRVVLERPLRLPVAWKPNLESRPRASQFLILGAKCHAVINGKYSPDIEDVQAIAKPILSHRIVRSYHAEAEGLSTDDIIEQLF